MTAAFVLDLLLAVMILACAAWTLLARTTLVAVLAFAAFGLLLALAWVRLDAVDVALTEAPVGVLTSLLLLGAATRLPPTARGAGPALALRLLVGLLCAGITAALAAAVLLLPEPAPSLAVAAEAGLPATGLGNPVTAVLMAYRALDTLMEKVVLVVGLLAVWSLAEDPLWAGRPAAPAAADPDGPLAFLARLLPPVGIVVAVYVFWVSADEPGGAFQGGAILAAMLLLTIMAGLVETPALGSRPLRLALVGGALVFFAVGLGGLLLGDGFLAYPEAFAKPLILAVEAALIVAIALSLALFVAGPGVRPRR
ncbi:MAG: Na(+)/H(+) antiporter subunit B [Geminicoccaceae bacterium]